MKNWKMVALIMLVLGVSAILFLSRNEGYPVKNKVIRAHMKALESAVSVLKKQAKRTEKSCHDTNDTESRLTCIDSLISMENDAQKVLNIAGQAPLFLQEESPKLTQGEFLKAADWYSGKMTETENLVASLHLIQGKLQPK